MVIDRRWKRMQRSRGHGFAWSLPQSSASFRYKIGYYYLSYSNAFMTNKIFFLPWWQSCSFRDVIILLQLLSRCFVPTGHNRVRRRGWIVRHQHVRGDHRLFLPGRQLPVELRQLAAADHTRRGRLSSTLVRQQQLHHQRTRVGLQQLLGGQGRIGYRGHVTVRNKSMNFLISATQCW